MGVKNWLVGAAILLPLAAHAQSTYSTVRLGTANLMPNASVPGVVIDCLTANFVATACGTNGTQGIPVTVVGGSSTGSSTPAVTPSYAETDASYTANQTATVPTGLGAVASRIELHIQNENTGSGAFACFNNSGTAAVSADGMSCAPGSLKLVAGQFYGADAPANVTPEAISIVCSGASCPLTIKVR